MDTAGPDHLLVERILEGDEDAFATLVVRYSGALLRIAMTFVKSRAVAEEVVQETWVALLDGVRSFEGRSSLKTWLFRILVNRAKTRATRDGRVVPFSSLASDPTEDAGSGPAQPAGVERKEFNALGFWSTPPRRWSDDAPEGELLRKELRRLLHDEIDRLPPNQRAVVILRDIEERSSEEVCNILEISEPNQRVLLHRGRMKLRAALEQHLADSEQTEASQVKQS